ncbi:MAG: SufE [Parachlamydia sp.]|nr:MAG: SufE [Parachlamydia sp.]
MFSSCLLKQREVKTLFNACVSEEKKYEKIIELGRELPLLDPAYQTPENIVKGCQSTMYLRSFMQEGKVFFQAQSDALISAGLAAILMLVYSGETPETILKCSPDYLEELGINASLTPNRANGLYSIHLRMKQDALKFLLQSQVSST